MLTRISTYPSWADDSICSQTDPEKWFPEHFAYELIPMGICQKCPVQTECATYALETQPEYGIWAGAPVRAISHLYDTFHKMTKKQRLTAVQQVITIGRQLLTKELNSREASRQRELTRMATKRKEYKERKANAA